MDSQPGLLIVGKTKGGSDRCEPLFELAICCPLMPGRYSALAARVVVPQGRGRWVSLLRPENSKPAARYGAGMMSPISDGVIGSEPVSLAAYGQRGRLEQRWTMMFGLIMYLLGVLTVFGVMGFLILRSVPSTEQGRSLPF